MAVSKRTKEYCMHNLVMMVINELSILYPNTSVNALMVEFAKSRTYSLLLNEKSGLWREGAGYILEMYAKEKGIKMPD